MDLTREKERLDRALTAQDYGQLSEILKSLQDANCSKAELEMSKIGATVNRIRKLEDFPEQSQLATSLLMKWRDILLGKKEEESEQEDVKNVAETEKNKESESGESDIKRRRSSEDDAGVKKAKWLEDETLTPIRQKCVEMLCTAMRQGAEGDPDELTVEIAMQVEAALFAEFQNTEAAYKAKFRSKYLNLKDKQNSALREGLCNGFITPLRLIQMTSAVLRQAPYNIDLFRRWPVKSDND